MKLRNMAEDANLEESVFKTLSHQKRRDISRFIGERREVAFTEIMNSVEVEDSPSLSYHLNALAPPYLKERSEQWCSGRDRNTFLLVKMCRIYLARVRNSPGLP